MAYSLEETVNYSIKYLVYNIFNRHFIPTKVPTGPRVGGWSVPGSGCKSVYYSDKNVLIRTYLTEFKNLVTSIVKSKYVYP